MRKDLEITELFIFYPAENDKRFFIFIAILQVISAYFDNIFIILQEIKY